MSSNRYNVLMVGGRDHTFTRLKELGLRYSAFQKRKLMTPHLTENAERIFMLDYEDVNLCVAIAAVAHERDPFDAVFSFAEYGFLSAARIAETLELPSNCQTGPVMRSRNKRIMREVMDAAGMQNIPFSRVATIGDIRSFVREHGESVVKPAEGGGSEGVYFVNPETDFERALTHALQVERNEILIEKFIPGPEYSVESMSVDGRHHILTMTEKTTTGAPYFIECGHVQPARLSDEVYTAVAQKVSNLLDVLGYQTGPAHTEVKLHEGTIYIIETQTRNGGDQIWELTLATTGIDLFKETFTTIMGLGTAAPQPTAKAMAIRYIMAIGMTLSDVSGVDRASSAEYVCRVEMNAKIGHRYPSVPSAETRIGYVLASGADAEQALANSERAAAEISLSGTSVPETDPT